MSQTRTVRSHMTAINGINVELEWTSCKRDNRTEDKRLDQQLIHPEVKLFADDTLLFVFKD